MVKKIMFTLIALTLLLFAGCNNENKIEVNDFESCAAAGNPVMESYPAKCSYNGETYTQVLSLKEQCEFNQGNWLEGFNECEGISESSCSQIGGEFNSCASACRNNPEAEICTMQCVQVCQFEIENNKESKICTKEYAPVCGIDNVTYSNKCMAGDIEIQHLGKCFNQEDKLECESKGGEYGQYGMAQMWQCNMPTNDFGKACENSDECSGICMSENGTGVCSKFSINFGCIPVIENGEEVFICID